MMMGRDGSLVLIRPFKVSNPGDGRSGQWAAEDELTSSLQSIIGTNILRLTRMGFSQITFWRSLSAHNRIVRRDCSFEVYRPTNTLALRKYLIVLFPIATL